MKYIIYIPLIILFGVLFYLAWFRGKETQDTLIKIYRPTPMYELYKDWMHSRRYLWSFRLFSTIFLAIVIVFAALEFLNIASFFNR